MASGSRDSSEYFLEDAGGYEDGDSEAAAEDRIEDEDDDIEMAGSIDNEGDRVSRSSSVISQQWPQSFRYLRFFLR